MEDFSFISLYRSIEEMFASLDDRPTARILRHQNVVLGKREVCQMTNVPGGIAFDDMYQVWIADLCGNNLYNITEKVAIREYTHDSNGTPQLTFEILPLGYERGGVHFILKFIGQAETFYSSPVLLGGFGEITHLDYWNTKEFEGISYLNGQTKQAVSLQGINRTGIEPQSVVSVYDQKLSTGSMTRITPKVNRLWTRKYVFQWIPEFIYERLQIALNHDFVYLDGVRITDKPQLQSVEWEGESNFGGVEFTAAYNKSDTYQYQYQVFSPFSVVSLSPQGLFTIATLPDTIEITFNAPFELAEGTVTLSDNDGVVQTWTTGTITDNTFSVPNPVDSNGLYSVIVTAGMFVGQLGVSEQLEWTFEVVNGQYKESQYKPSQYLTGS